MLFLRFCSFINIHCYYVLCVLFVLLLIYYVLLLICTVTVYYVLYMYSWQVDDLARLSLRRPVRVKTSLTTGALAPRLIQEFVKIKSDEEREAMLISLIHRTFHNRTIVFCETKKETHRVYLILKLLNVAVGELHGNMTQPQRYHSLEQFRVSEVDVLVATDVAARGLDIKGVQTIINAEMCRNSSTYIHRVGRTARAGAGGRAITLVSDGRRKVVKDMLKSDAALLSSTNSNNKNDDNQKIIENELKGRILSRSIPANVIQEYSTKISELEPKILELIHEENLENSLNNAIHEADRAENLLKFESEINARPARTWYQTETQKQAKKGLTRQLAIEESEQLNNNNDDDDTTTGTKTQKKQLAIQMSDNYKLDSKEVLKDQTHRLNRKKRRRLEALKDIAADKEEETKERLENNNNGNDTTSSKQHLSKKSIKIKQQKEQTELNKKTKSIAEMGELREIKKRSRLQLEGKQNKNNTKNLMRPRFAVGGFDMENDYGSGGSSSIGGGSKGGLNAKKIKMQDRKIETELAYEYDPSKKLRKGGKVGTSSFKSKKRFKRR